MKKTYKNPEIEIVKIQTLKMLAGSPGEAHEELPDMYGSREDENFDW